VMESSVFIPFEWATPVEDVPVTRMGRAIPLRQICSNGAKSDIHTIKIKMSKTEDHYRDIN